MEALARGNYYEAHQLYMSMAQRCLKQKKPDEALEILQEGIHELAKHGQMKSVLDLSERLLATMEAPWKPLYRKHIATVLEVLKLPLPTGKAFIDRALELSVRLNHGQEDPILHSEIARAYIQAEDVEGSLGHFLLAPNSSLSDLAEAIISRRSPSREFDILTLNVTVKFLQEKKLQEAAQILDMLISSCSHHDKLVDCQEIYSSSNPDANESTAGTAIQPLRITCHSQMPLFNMAQLLVFAAQMSNEAVLRQLTEHYHSKLTPDLVTKLQALATSSVYFGKGSSPPARISSNMGDIFQQVLRGFFQPSSSRQSQVPSQASQPELD